MTMQNGSKVELKFQIKQLEKKVAELERQLADTYIKNTNNERVYFKKLLEKNQKLIKMVHDLSAMEGNL